MTVQIHYRSLDTHHARCTTDWVEMTATTKKGTTCPACLALVRGTDRTRFTPKYGKPFWIGTDKAPGGQTTYSTKRMKLDKQGYFRRREDTPHDFDPPDQEEMDRLLEDFGIIPPPGVQVRVRIQVIA